MSLSSLLGLTRSQPTQIVPASISEPKIAEEIAAEKRQLEEDSKSSKELMQECAEEWNSVLEICKLLWSSAKDKLKVDARSSENKERILNLIFTCSSIEPLFKKSGYLSILEDKPYDWIENWKKTTKHVIRVVRLNGVKIDLWIIGVVLARIHTLLPDGVSIVPPLNVWKLGVFVCRSMLGLVGTQGRVMILGPLTGQLGL